MKLMKLKKRVAAATVASGLGLSRLAMGSGVASAAPPAALPAGPAVHRWPARTPARCQSRCPNRARATCVRSAPTTSGCAPSGLGTAPERATNAA